MTERWLPIPLFFGYEVSDAGRVRSVDRYVRDRRHRRHFVRGQLMRTKPNRYGYPCVFLNLSGRKNPLLQSVHRLVMLAFDPREDASKLHVNHIDGDKGNPQLVNLQWCTPSQNRWHAHHILGRPTPPLSYGAAHANSVGVIGYCMATHEIRRYGAVALVKPDGFDPTQVSACASGNQGSHRGWLWQYADRPLKPWVYTPKKTGSGADNPVAKPVERVAKDGSVVRYAAASLAFPEGFTDVGISHCVTGRQRSHRGFAWRYAEVAA